jgi:hypothetical protein
MVPEFYTLRAYVYELRKYKIVKQLLGLLDP